MAIDDQDLQYMKIALQLAAKAESEGEVPVGAVLVRDDKIIGEGWNCPISQHDPSAHAEIMALRDAGNKAQNYRLPESILYVTLEPCPMCAGAIVHARVKRVVFGAFDPRSGSAGSVFDLLPTDERFNHSVDVVAGCLENECAEILRAFFQAKRQVRKGHEHPSIAQSNS